MRMSQLAFTPLALVVALSPLSGQDRVVDLTGAPDSRISAPYSLIIGLQPLATGQVLVSDLIDQTVELVEFATQQRLPVGRQGGGPGEWQVPARAMAGPDGSAYLVDAGKQAVHRVEADGRVTASVPWPVLPGEPIGAAPMNGDGKGGIFVQGSGFGRSGPDDSLSIRHWNPATGEVVPLTSIPNPRRMQSATLGNGQMAVPGGAAAPFATSVAWVGLPDGGLATVHPEPYRVDRITPTGTLVRGQTLASAPIRVTAAERDAWREAQAGQTTVARSATRGVIRGGGSQATVPDAAFPATLPPFVANARVVPDPEGNVWIERTNAATAPDRTWDIVRPGAGRIGVAKLPIDAVVAAIDPEYIYLIRTDGETGLQTLERHRG